jgi:glycosyltransferase involved in cell wall biosynthesis
VRQQDIRKRPAGHPGSAGGTSRERPAGHGGFRLGAVRILIFHGYLLSGTGSNVYNARLAQALVAQGHEVHLLCQERHPERCEFASAAGDWDSGELTVRPLVDGVGGDEPARDRMAYGAAAARGSCTLYRPDIGRLLPVYVQDRYEGLDARTFAGCSDAEVAAYVQANVEAVGQVAALAEPEVALANHLVMGPAILARALGGRVPYAAKVHGSALEYTVKPEPDRFLGYAREGLAGANTVLVGSMHTARSLWRALAPDPSLPSRTRLGPPGVDVERFTPRDPERARAGVRERALRLREQARQLREGTVDTDGEQASEPASAFARDELEASAALERAADADGPLVAFVGKLIAAKGVDLLLEAWPLILQSHPRARLLVIGFGSERERYERAAAAMAERVIFTGRLEHEELADVLPLCAALVVPSTFPEAFGMVAVEAAACAVLPISAAHSGLAEVSEALAKAVPPETRALLSFPIDEQASAAIAERVLGWLEAREQLRARTREALVATVHERWSWQGVARGVIAAALGDPESPLARAVG